MIKSNLIALWVAIALLSSMLSAAQLSNPMRVADSVQEKKLIKKVEPVYPESARLVPVQGPVVLDVIANDKGEVVDVKIVRGGNPVVQKPVYVAVKQWRYAPTYVGGKAVSVKFRVTVTVEEIKK